MKRFGFATLMVVSLTLTSGSGSIGDIEPNWSVQEDITPASPGDPTAGTGQVSFDCEYGEDSEFVIDNPSEFAHPEMGSVFGKVDTVSPNGATDDSSTDLSITTSTTLKRLNVDRNVAPVWFENNVVTPTVLVGAETAQVAEPYGVATAPGSNYIYVTSSGRIAAKTGPNAGSLMDRYKVIRFDKTTGAYVSEWGSYGVGSGAFLSTSGIAVNWASGYTVYVFDGAQSKVHVFTQAGVWVASYGSTGTGNGQFSASSLTGRIATDSAGNYYVTDYGNSRLQKFSNTGTYLAQVSFSGFFTPGQPYGLTIDQNDKIIVTLLNQAGISANQNEVRIYNTSLVLQSSFIYQYDANTLPSGQYANGLGMIAAAHGGTSFWANPLWANYAVLLDYNGNELERYYSSYPAPANANDKYSLAVDGETLYMLAQGLANNPSSNFYNSPSNMMQVFNYTPITLSAAIQGYVDEIDPTLVIDYTADDDPYVFLPGWSGNVWKYLSDLCVAYSLEISLVNGTIMVRDRGTVALDVDDTIAGSTRMSLDTTATGRSINIINYNTRSGSGILYNARDDGKIFSVGAGEVVTETVRTTNYPVLINQPAQTDNITVLGGQYFVIGSDNLPVVSSQWKDYGGSVSVTISDTVPGGIDVTITGPRVEIPGVAAPYSLGISDGSTTYPAFSVTGSGVFTSPETINLLTGADPEKTAQEVALDIDNIFIDTLERAYDTGAWSCAFASGPQITLGADVPTSSLNGFGEIAGSVSVVREAKYRVASASVGAASSSVSWSPYTTTEDFDALWAGDNTGDFDAFWAGNDSLDVKVKPLRHP